MQVFERISNFLRETHKLLILKPPKSSRKKLLDFKKVL